MKTHMALAALAAAVFAAPAPDADSDPYAHLKHDTICQGSEGSFVMTCVPAYFDGYMAQQCRSGCMAPGTNANCINLANAVHGDGSPKFTVVPYIAPNVTKLNNDTAECYRFAACSELHKYASCVQCLVNDPSTFKGTGVSKKDLVKEINGDLPQFEPFCQSLGVNASNYTFINLNRGAMATTATGWPLLLLGITAASLI